MIATYQLKEVIDKDVVDPLNAMDKLYLKQKMSMFCPLLSRE
jgi:hypothetical protein